LDESKGKSNESDDISPIYSPNTLGSSRGKRFNNLELKPVDEFPEHQKSNKAKDALEDKDGRTQNNNSNSDEE
jgi:hypothetical protein